MKQLLGILLVIMCCQQAARSQVMYLYDENGNMYKRYLYTVTLKLALDQDSVVITDTMLAQASTDSLDDETPEEQINKQQGSETNSVTLYPTITNDVLTASLVGYESGKVCIYSKDGKLLSVTMLSAGNNSLPMGVQPAGTYIVIVTVNKRKLVYTVVKI